MFVACTYLQKMWLRECGRAVLQHRLAPGNRGARRQRRACFRAPEIVRKLRSTNHLLSFVECSERLGGSVLRPGDARKLCRGGAASTSHHGESQKSLPWRSTFPGKAEASSWPLTNQGAGHKERQHTSPALRPRRYRA